MAHLPARRGLNPGAPEFYPKFTQPEFLPYPFPPTFSLPAQSFLYPPFYSHPLYTATFSHQNPPPLSISPLPPPLQPTPPPPPPPPSSRTTSEVEQTQVDKKVVYEKVKKGGGTRRIRTAKHACGSTSSNHGEKLWFEKLTPKFERKRSYFPIIPVKFGEEQTTVMIRNIPNKYNREMVLEFLDDFCRRENQRIGLEISTEGEEETYSTAYDFFYLPIDFRSDCNKGYAFVNFTDPRAVWKLYVETNNKPWPKFQSSKRRNIALANIQGKEALIRHFEKSTFACGSDDYLPICFSEPRDGSSRESKRQTTVGKRIAPPYVGPLTTTSVSSARNKKDLVPPS